MDIHNDISYIYYSPSMDRPRGGLLHHFEVAFATHGVAGRHRLPFVAQLTPWRSRTKHWGCHVVKTRINEPFGNGLNHLFMVIWGMWYQGQNGECNSKWSEHFQFQIIYPYFAILIADDDWWADGNGAWWGIECMTPAPKKKNIVTLNTWTCTLW